MMIVMMDGVFGDDWSWKEQPAYRHSLEIVETEGRVLL